MTCPHCSCALGVAGLPCPRCGHMMPSALSRQNASYPSASHQPDTPTPSGNQTSQAPKKESWGALWGTALACSAVIYTLMSLANSRAKPSSPPSPVTAPPQQVIATQSPQAAPTAADPLAGIPVGPTFQQVDSTMDDRRIDLTDAQRQAFWDTVSGKVITWTGTIHNVYANGDGQISMQCNPNSLLSDVRVSLDGSQMDLLPQLRKGQRVTVRGLLNDHSSFGYGITQGQVIR